MGFVAFSAPYPNHLGLPAAYVCLCLFPQHGPGRKHEREKAGEFFGSLSYSEKKWYVLPIEQAKAPATRERRVAKAIGMLREGRKRKRQTRKGSSARRARSARHAT